jgi:hypothetical protein
MSKAEILAELPKLAPEDRAEIQAKLEELAGDGWLDANDPLTHEQKALLEARLEDLERHPEQSIPWSKAKTQLKTRFGV